MSALARIQGRLRGSIAHQWEELNSRSYFWAAKGKGVDRCVWRQALWAEWATNRGLKAASVLIDLRKAFEKLDFGKLIAAAQSDATGK